MKKQIYFLMCCAVLLLSMALLGCSKDESSTAPSNSTIVVNPSSASFTVMDGLWHTEYFTITVLDANGRPMNNTDINIYFWLGNPDQEGLVQLVDSSGNAVPSPFKATTDDNGVYNLRFDFWAVKEYSGVVEVRSGAAFGSATFEVKAP